MPQADPYELAMERRKKMEASKAPKEISVESTVNKVVENFTRIPEMLIEALLSTTINYTPLDLSEHEQLQKEQQDLAAVRRRLQALRGEEEDARQYFKQKNLEKQRSQEEEEQRKAQEEHERRQAENAAEEPGSKQARGSLFAKKKKARPQKTIENKAGQSKN